MFWYGRCRSGESPLLGPRRGPRDQRAGRNVVQTGKTVLVVLM
jgi:hypothetical protein